MIETIETILRVYFRIQQHSYKPGQKETSTSNPFLCAVDFLEDTLAEISKLAAYWQYFLFGAYCNIACCIEGLAFIDIVLKARIIQDESRKL